MIAESGAGARGTARCRTGPRPPIRFGIMHDMYHMIHIARPIRSSGVADAYQTGKSSIPANRTGRAPARAATIPCGKVAVAPSQRAEDAGIRYAQQRQY